MEPAPRFFTCELLSATETLHKVFLQRFLSRIRNTKNTWIRISIEYSSWIRIHKKLVRVLSHDLNNEHLTKVKAACKLVSYSRVDTVTRVTTHFHVSQLKSYTYCTIKDWEQKSHLSSVIFWKNFQVISSGLLSSSLLEFCCYHFCYWNV